MQIVDCFVRLNGSVEFEVAKPGITVAEVALLRALHGEDAVVRITAGPVVDVKPRTVKNDLLARYSADGPKKVIETLFPGMYPKVPETLGDVGLELASLAGARRPAGVTLVTASALPPPPEGEVVAIKQPEPQDDDDETDDGSAYAAEDAKRAPRDD